MKQLLENLLKLSAENEVVEFKEAKNQFDKNKLGQYFSALGNEANLRGQAQAWLIFGVKNDRTLVGTKISETQLNDYKAEIPQHTSPRSTFANVHRVQKDGFETILFEIPAALQGQPVSWKGFKYGRDGESLGPLNDSEIDRIKSQTTHEDWSARIINDAKISDLSPAAIETARIQYAQKNPRLAKEITNWSTQIFLNKAKITINSKITPTTIILLGRPEAGHYLSPSSARITWILKDNDNIEKDYEHFTCPLLLSVDEVYNKIRNLKYRYIKDDTLFPEEVDQYDPYIIREALNNCIAHQDYAMGGGIVVVENEKATLTFANSGSFIPQSVEKVIKADAPESIYRNRFLAEAMVNLNMIDTIGSGIKRMFNIQRSKYFPLPEYDISGNKVTVQIVGKVLNIDYARKLAQMPNLSLEAIMALDKVVKKKPLSNIEIQILKSKRLIEGRKPNFHISSKVASVTGQKGAYIKMKGIDNDYIQKIIVDYLKEFKSAKRKDLENVLLNKLSEGLDITQKKNKIKNNLQTLKNKGFIEVDGKEWKMSK